MDLQDNAQQHEQAAEDVVTLAETLGIEVSHNRVYAGYPASTRMTIRADDLTRLINLAKVSLKG